MAGASVKLTVSGADKVVAELRGARNRLNDFTKPLKQGGLVMLRSVDKNFRAGGRPAPWRPLSPKYLRRKVGRGYSPTPLVRSGARGLQGSVSFDAMPRRLAVGTNIIYGRIHQLGGNAGRNHAAHIPARPYLVFQDEDIDTINKLVAEYVTEGI